MNICPQCQSPFEISPEDLAFYEKISPEFSGKKYLIPPPTLCPDCRLQRKVAWRNERFLYPQTCGKCAKNIVSVYAPDAKHPVYCHSCWWGDSWDAQAYGRDFDFSRSFFEQLRELLDVVPQLAIQNDDGIGSQNCQYCQDFAFGKNCYFVIGSWYSQDSFYCNMNASHNRNICDCMNVSRSELVYESLDCASLYNCIFMQNSENCSDCFFGFDLKGCRNCFGCVGLRQKEFYIFNQPYSEEEYRKKLKEYDFGSSAGLEKMRKEYAQWILQFPRKNMNLQNCENCEGNDLFYSNESFHCFGLLKADHAKYCYQGDMNMYSYDIFNSGRPNWCYEGLTPDDSYMTHFSWFSWKSKNVLYGINCHSSENLFGCVSLHRAKYCILNKQYSQEEYEALVPKIIEHMKKTQEWGEFPPAAISFFGYNETVAQEYFPLTQEEVLKRGWKWRDPDLKEYQPQSFILPDHIRDVSDDLPQKVLACVECSKNYKIIPQELKLYQQMGLPIPRKCSLCRQFDRLRIRPPYKLWERPCGKCSMNMKTVYSLDRPEKVLCEKCYLDVLA